MSNNAENGNNPSENLDFAFQIMSQKLDRQNDAHNSLETKIGILFGFVGIITGTMIALLWGKNDLVGVNCLTFGLGGICVSLLLLALASVTRNYLDPPDFQTFFSSKALNEKVIDVKNQVVADMKASYVNNGRNQIVKSRLYNSAIFCFLLSMILLFVGVIGG